MTRYTAFRDRFREAMDPRFYTIEYLDWLVAEGRGLVWGNEDAAIVAEVKTFPTGSKAIHGLVAAGDLATIINVLIPEAEAWGRANGCAFAMIESRPGWARALKDYRPHTASVVKEL